eukprot:TRINITY_DN284_c0_g3_i1.p1 TRINITY_DN284_c0_g3~~TRINITY_DN284_c0_g3_i1.p1  ORF type:complete len:248 (+),score=60.25 TRINITY_DN284_c0_g3_i1:40-783(+)
MMEDLRTVMGEEVFVAAAVGLITLLIVLVYMGVFRKRKGTVGDKVVMVGLPGSGKTALFFKMLKGQEVETQTSVIVNQEQTEFGLKTKKRKMFIDYPGHFRLRPGLMPNCEDACEILFVIDAIDWESNLSPNAELLVALLTNPKIVHQTCRPSLAVVCTKRDVGHSYKSTAIKKQLEKEIDKVRKTKINVVNQLGSEGADVVELGDDHEKFTFEAHSPLDTTFFDVSARGDGVNLEGLRQWMDSHIQ